MKKKNNSPIEKMMKLGLGMGTTSIVLGTFPANPVTPQVTAGMAKVSTAFPAYGKIAGAAIVIKQSKRLLKSTKKLKY